MSRCAGRSPIRSPGADSAGSGGRVGATSDHVDEADHPVRVSGGGRGSTKPCWPRRRRPSCCAPAGSGWTPPWWRPTWPIRPIRGCWPARFAGSRRPAGGSKPPVGRCAPGCGTARGRLGGERMRSPPSCAPARRPVARRPRPWCGGSAGSWPTGRHRRRRRWAAAGQRQTGTAPGPGRGRRAAPTWCADGAAGRRRGRLARAVNELTELLDAARQIVAQTRQRVAGITPDGATRRVSLHDPDVRPIAKGRLGRPVEFAHKAQMVDNDDGVVLDHSVEQGNPPDAPQLAPRWLG